MDDFSLQFAILIKLNNLRFIIPTLFLVGACGHLRKLLDQRESGGVIFTTIQKFSPEENGDPVAILTERKNVVVIAD